MRGDDDGSAYPGEWIRVVRAGVVRYASTCARVCVQTPVTCSLSWRTVDKQKLVAAKRRDQTPRANSQNRGANASGAGPSSAAPRARGCRHGRGGRVPDMRRPRPDRRARRAVPVPRRDALGAQILRADLDQHRQRPGATERRVRGVRRDVGGRVRHPRAVGPIPGGVREARARAPVVGVRPRDDGRAARAGRALAAASRPARPGAVAGVAPARCRQIAERVRAVEGTGGAGDVAGGQAERRLGRSQALGSEGQRECKCKCKCKCSPTRRQPSSCGCFGMGAREEGGRGRRGRRGSDAAVQPPGDQRA